MIEWAGLGVAVSNADERLKSAADAVTNKEMSYGVLEAIDQFF
jgi:hydroxymethylpyrimidine pyrophosphatase-like HAD family hydrolase